MNQNLQKRIDAMMTNGLFVATVLIITVGVAFALLFWLGAL